MSKSNENLLKKRRECMSRALSGEEIASLLSIRFNREPLYSSIEELYSEHYLKALQDGLKGSQLDTIAKYRTATERDANLLYCDPNAKGIEN